MTITRDLLTGLVPRVDLLAAPCRRHREEEAISRATADWAVHFGLVPDSSPIDRQRIGELASRSFPESRLEVAVLFGQWLAWLLVFDDLRDDSPLGHDQKAVDQLYRGLLDITDFGESTVDTHPVHTAFADLWARTAPQASPQWALRFTDHLRLTQAACTLEARDRADRHPPGPDTYVELRRHAVGAFMFQLPEALLKAPIADQLHRCPEWTSLLEASVDILAWTNDIASYEHETAEGNPHNYVTVLQRAHGFTRAEAAAQVCDQIVYRCADLRRHARELPDAFDRLGLTEREERAASKVAVTLLGVPRGHHEWLLESDRYQPH